MQKITLFAAAVAMTVGLSAVSSSAFAMGCLDPNLPAMSLSHNDLKPNAGFGYNKSAYDAEDAKGNACATTEQSYSTRQASVERTRQVSHPVTAPAATLPTVSQSIAPELN